MSCEEVELLSDSKYRQFIAAVEKALRSFESTSEWADLISALGKLNKVLNTHARYAVIPRKLMIGKRLSQCMHPALPSGVHLKTLETYNLIFERIGKKYLSQDLFIYTVGLFPLMSHSAMSVKPVLMKLYEDHFLPLGSALVPSLPGLLLGLLPGIEEGSDYTGRTISLLESLSIATDIDIFFDGLWQSVITTPSVRLPATIFLLSQLDKKLPPCEQKHLLGSNHAFMVQGVCLALNDTLALVQRNILDFVVLIFPLHVPNLSYIYISNIMTAALGILWRRDMSLNRRLYAWILGSNGGRQSQLTGSIIEDDSMQYFEKFSKQLVVDGMKALFRQMNTPGVEAVLKGKVCKLELLKPFRILLNLLDKPEIGSSILEDVLIEVFKNLYIAQQHFNVKENESKGRSLASKEQENKTRDNPMEELIKTSNLLFNTFEPYFMWQYIAKLFAQCTIKTYNSSDGDRGDKSPWGETNVNDDKLQLLDVIRLTDFILNIVALESSVETESLHWPQLLSQIILQLTKGCEKFTLEELEEGILLCSKLLSKLTPSTNFMAQDVTRGIVSSGLSPNRENFDSDDSIEYDSKTFDDSVETSGTRDRLDSSREQSEKSREIFQESRVHAVVIPPVNEVVTRDPNEESRDKDSLPSEEVVTSENIETPKFIGREDMTDEVSSSVKLFIKNGRIKDKEKAEISKEEGFKERENDNKNDKNTRSEEKRENVKEGKLRGKSRKTKKADFPGNILLHGDDKMKEESKMEEQSQSLLIKTCIEYYLNFILEFFKWKIFHDTTVMDRLMKDSEMKGVNTCYEINMTCATHVSDTSSSRCREAKAHTAMCKLLVELSCFPMQGRTTFEDRDKDNLPLWLRCFLASCQIEDFDIQSTSISTVLDLINLTLSVNPAALSTTGVIVIPILTIQEVILIEKSDMYKVIASSLWSILGKPLPVHHRKAVELLIQLHNLTPSPRLCENVIGSSMVAAQKENRLEALKRFANLWHIAKSILSQTVQERTARGLRTFDRSLFVMLDGLESDEPEIRSLTKMWVSHSLEQGDIGRILEPLLLLLLHPSTARVSRFYCERVKKRRQQKEGQGVPEDEDVHDEILGDMNDEGIEGQKSNNNDGQSSSVVQTSADMHKVHYSGKCDYHRILYAFRTLSGILRVVPRQFVCASAATSIGSSFGPYEERIKELLIRHKRSLLGKGFYGPLFGDQGSSGRVSINPNTSKYLEILITITLYFIRSNYLPSSNISPELLEGNIKTQVSSLECLTNLMWELVKLVRESGHGFGNFITDLLSRCRVQKAIIHCLSATVEHDTTFSRTSADDSRSNSSTSSTSRADTAEQIILQSKLLEVVESLIVLEHALSCSVQALTPDHHGNTDFEVIMKAGEEGGPNMEGYTSRFLQGKPLSSQEMLLNMVLHCLKARERFELSSRWTGFVIECLPYLGTDLLKWIVPVVLQMCSNIYGVTGVFRDHRNSQCSIWSRRHEYIIYPPDYLLALLAGLTSLSHFCLLDAVSSPVFTVQPRAGTAVTSPGIDSPSKPARSMQIFANLLHAFTSNSKSSDPSLSSQHPSPLYEAREGLLSILPRIIASLLSIWGVWDLDNLSETLPSSMVLLGTPKALRHSILQLLTPVAMTHTIVFIASIADVWNKKKLIAKDHELKSKFYLAKSDDQLRVISLVFDIKALSLEVLIETVRQILNQETIKHDEGFEFSLLQFLHEFLLRSSSNHLSQVKSSFLTLIKDALQLNLPPPAVILLLVILHTFSRKVSVKDDRKCRKETQDVAQRLIESCTTIAGLSLGSSAWFSRNLSVIALPEINDNDSFNQSPGDDTASNEVTFEPVKKPESDSNSSKHSTHALVVLADLLSSLLDILFGIEEKERVNHFLINVMANVTPYLRNHSPANVPSFRACCALIASLSSYQYTRKAWRRETFELFFEANFFQMVSECVGNWRIIIDNLFTQDQASFRELMARATVTSTTTLSLFGNHDLEMQQRALMLRRLSFGVFSSEPDQYQSFLPELQERLAECLRMPQVPVLQEQVFLFFRVLLLRMSDNMTSIWPMIISEMIHVFILMESDLSQGNKPSRDQQMLYSETILGSSGYVKYSQEKWLGLYLAVCKLLDMALCLPSEQLPQFQMYRWAFECSGIAIANAHGLNDINHVESRTDDSHLVESKKVARKKMAADKDIVRVFRPYVSRITQLLSKRKNIYVDQEPVECHPGRPLLTMYQLESVEELLPFLNMLSNEGRILLDLRTNEEQKQRRFRIGSRNRNYLERLIERDFLDPLQE